MLVCLSTCLCYGEGMRKLNTTEAKLNAAEANAMRIAPEFEEYKKLHP